jgi:hypothetical protein
MPFDEALEPCVICVNIEHAKKKKSSGGKKAPP